MQHMTLFLAKWFGWSDGRSMINDQFIIVTWNRPTFFCPLVWPFLLSHPCLVLIFSIFHGCCGCGIYVRIRMRHIFVKISILTWLPSCCQKTVGWGLPLVSQGKVAVRPWATIWSRGRTTNWGASEVKGETNRFTIPAHLHRVSIIDYLKTTTT